jgi:hypothetical protein
MDLIEKYLGEAKDTGVQTKGDGMGIDGLSKARVKTLLYKETKKCTYNRTYNDEYWQGPKCIWDAFHKLNLNWQIDSSKYMHIYNDKTEMPDSKEWAFTIMWDDNKGKHQKISGTVRATGGRREGRYDVNMVLF